MKSKVCLVLAMAFFAAFAAGNAITINTPSSNQTIPLGQTISLDYNSDFNMVTSSASVIFNNNWSQRLELYSVYMNSSPKMRYSTKVNTEGWPAGPVRIDVTGLRHENGVYSSGSAAINLVIAPSDYSTDLNSAARVVRSIPQTVYPGGYAIFSLLIFPNKPFPGLIVRENFKNSGMKYDAMNVSSWGNGTEATANSMPDLNFLKIVLRSPQNIGMLALQYFVRIPEDAEPGTILELDGNWSVEGEEGLTIGDKSTKIGGFKMPDCPLSDQVLLQYITKWSKMEIANNELLQVVQKWKGC